MLSLAYTLAYTLFIYHAILLPRPPVVPKWGRGEDSCERNPRCLKHLSDYSRWDSCCHPRRTYRYVSSKGMDEFSIYGPKAPWIQVIIVKLRLPQLLSASLTLDSQTLGLRR